MAIEVFNRSEYKYILDEEQFERMIDFISGYTSPDPYNKGGEVYTISNIYYDTENDDLIRNSLEKPLYKEKLRLRAYGVPKRGDKVYLELKKKFKGVVNKRRTALELGEAYSFAESRKIKSEKDYMNMQVVRELEYFLGIYRVVTKVYIAYDRLAFFGNYDENLRISFDMNIRTRRESLRLENGDFGKQLMPRGTYIMEIKDLYAMPLWLANELGERGIRRASFSKYGMEYRRRNLISAIDDNESKAAALAAV